MRVTAADTDGAFTLITDVAPPGWRLPPHRHAKESETIHVTAGALLLDIDGERRELRAGDTAFIGPGTLHATATAGDEPVHRVLVFSPAGMEEFFVALAEVTDPAAMQDLAASYGWSFD